MLSKSEAHKRKAMYTLVLFHKSYFLEYSWGRWLFLFAPKEADYLREGNYLREVIISIFCFIILLNRKKITSSKLNMGFLSVPNLVPWLIFSVSSQCHYQQLNEKSLCQFLTWQGEDKRKRRWKGGWARWLFEGGDYFKNFHQRGTIIQGRRLIEGRLLFKEIQYSLKIIAQCFFLLALNFMM